VLTLGTFAVGVPDDDLVSATVDGDQPTDMQATAAKDSQGCGAGAAPCGATGMVTWFMMMTGLVAMRRHRR